MGDIGDIHAHRAIRAFDIKELGYRFSKRKIHLKASNYIVYELLNEDGYDILDFCFLFSKKKQLGIVVSFPFDKYLQIALEDKRGTKVLKK